ncbi:MAG: response regulator [Bacteriovoracaceae bacterium]|nr:response regulator [Bacteriovoracaceae bacterium]
MMLSRLKLPLNLEQLKKSYDQWFILAGLGVLVLTTIFIFWAVLRLENLTMSQSNSLKVQTQIDMIDGQIKDWIIAVQAKMIDPPPFANKRIRDIENNILLEIEDLSHMTSNSQDVSSNVSKLESLWKKLQKTRNEDGFQKIPPQIDGILEEIYQQEVNKLYEKDPLIIKNINLLVAITMLLTIIGFFIIFTAFKRIQRQNKIRQDLMIELQKSQQEAVESSLLKSNFLATMGHEIRTPLNGIIGLTEILQNDLSTIDQKYFLSLIHNSGKSLLKITNDILDYSKVETGKISLNLRPFSIQELLKQIKDATLPKSIEKNLSLEMELDPTISENVIGDAEKLSIILLNLVNNAIKFTAQGGVKVSVKKIHQTQLSQLGSDFGNVAQEIRFEVLDTGMGLTDEQKGQLFLPFVQLEQRGTHGEAGSGLGLSIAQSYAGLMSSSIKIESSKGKGSSFYFHVMLIPTGPKKIFSNYQVQDVRDLKNLPALLSKNILVAEDNHTNQIVAETFLKKMGMTVEIAENGEVVLSKMKQGASVDLIFMDLNMPVIDGISCTKILRQTYPELPIVAMTASLSPEEEQLALAAGMNCFCMKPISFESLSQTLNFVFHQDDFVYTFFTSNKIKKLRQTLGVNALKNVFLAFLKDLEECDKLNKSVTDWKHWGHKLKSSAALVGAESLSELLGKVELISHEDEEYHLSIKNAEEEMQKIIKILKKYLRK